MEKTQMLGLPIYAPEDIFDLTEVNKAHKNIEIAYQAMEGIQNVNANAEVIGARKGEPNLKTKIDKIDDAIETNANTIVSINNFTNTLERDIKNIGSSLDNVMHNQKIYVKDFGYVGDGVYDDSIAIQKAVDCANSLIERSTDVYEFLWNGCPSVVLPETPCYVKTPIIIENAIGIEGYNANSQIVINSDMECVFKYINHGNSITKNEEGQVVGTILKDFRINGNRRKFKVDYSILLQKQDNLTINNLSFFAIKGECIRFATVRESKFDNIYTRFCGDVDTPNLNFIYNAGDETNNLSFGDNWSLIFPFGQAIKLTNTDIQGVNNIVIHGMFDGIINKLLTYFNENTYDTSGHNFIELLDSSININRLSTTYCPSGKSDIKLSNSRCQLSNSRFTGHYGNMSTTSNDHFSKLENSSTMWIGNNVLFDSGTVDINIFECDDTSKIYGSPINNIAGNSGSYLNAPTIASLRGKSIQFRGELGTSAVFEMQDYYNNKMISGVGMISNVFKSTPHPNMSSSQGELLYMGYTENGAHPLVSVPNETVFTLPSVRTQNEGNLPGKAIFFDENGNLKIRKGGKTYTVTVTG